MEITKKYSFGVLLTVLIACLSINISKLIPNNLISAGVFSLLLGMMLNPILYRYTIFNHGTNFVSKKILRLAIILMGSTLSFSQVLEVGKYSLFVMIFTLLVAFGGGYYFGKLFGMNWKLSGLISAGTGICGASAVAAIAPTIEAEPKDIAYAISATFIFDIIMVILFPIWGRQLGLSDLGYGLWAGTAINDTSSVVAAGYAFSDAAGSFSIIVKLTRTLSIIPAVLIFSYINQRIESKKDNHKDYDYKNEKIDIRKIFPWFILMFLGVVGIKSLGLISEGLSTNISSLSKFFMIMSLGAIGLKTNFKEVSKSGILPAVHGFIISSLVVIVSYGVQLLIGKV